MFDVKRSEVLTVVDPDDDVLPVVSVTAIEATVANLVFREVPGIHDSKAAVIPLSTNVGLAVVWTVAAGGGTARILETATDLTPGAYGRVGHTPMGDVKIGLIMSNRVALSAVTNVGRNVFDTVMRDSLEVGVCPCSQQGAGIGERCCNCPCSKEEKWRGMEVHDGCSG